MVFIISPENISLSIIKLSVRNKKGPQCLAASPLFVWLRGPDLNRRPSGYEPDELPLLHPASFGLARTIGGEPPKSTRV